MVSGKEVRINRITRNGRMLCIPMDHGVSIGPVKGLDEIHSTIEKIEKGGATAILIHKGIIRSLKKPVNCGLIMHLSGSTDLGPSPNRKMWVSSVEEAIRLGADAVSVHVNIGCEEEPEMLVKLGSVADECDAWNIPLIAMMYPRGSYIKDPRNPDIIAHVARVGAELGADIVKTPYTGDPESFKKVVKGCPVPVVIAGGPKAENDREVLEMAKGALEAGAIGVTFGRNVFQHRDPTAIVRALHLIVMENASVERAMKELENVSKV
ncbi:MAG: 2-amino-3,7-dideoxy-D-threo-hept-6-ulosonate synthase [Nitrososphaerota archaeon]|nr:2-amino-3,7-dideoxy-D-threo-hept-6-ulosonate synthase [Nitrososphaerales archaeon]MDW8044170.1 2-amino-3,7-dideoxy-D-threo-hept-6-ulosonate synthase [Nitrososphaerota archaeon]